MFLLDFCACSHVYFYMYPCYNISKKSKGGYKMAKSVYEMVTDRIIAELQNGIIPWCKPWHGTHNGAFNRISKKPYSLLNQMLLRNAGEYATFDQWKKLGGHVRKGEKAEIVVFWKMQTVEERNADGETITKQIPMLRYYSVFHISQVSGVEPLPQEELAPLEPIAEAEKIKAEYSTREGLRIIEKVTDEAFYSPSADYVQVPCKDQYSDIVEYYSTLYHELIHSTGHATRLNRLMAGGLASFGSETYSREEMVAEIGSACLLNLLGIETPQSFKNSTAYIQNWLAVLKNDSRFIVSASSKAEKAVNYILGTR